MGKLILFFTIAVLAACSSGHSKKQTLADTAHVTSSQGTSGIEQMMNAEPDGDHIEKYPNGMMKIRGYILHGKREGQWASFYANGKQWSETYFTKGKKNGPTTTWYENGQKRYVGEYTNDEHTGKWSYWDEEGNSVDAEASGKPGT